MKVKYADFTLRTRSATLPEPVQDTDAIHRAAVELLARVPARGAPRAPDGRERQRHRAGRPAAGALPDAQAEKRRRVEEVAARIADRFGDERAVTRATLLKREK